MTGCLVEQGDKVSREGTEKIAYSTKESGAIAIAMTQGGKLVTTFKK